MPLATLTRTAAFAAFALLSACSTPDRIILLPDPDGKVGAVIVHSATGEQTINAAYAGIAVTKSGDIQKTMDSQSSVQTQYSDLLAARPIALNRKRSNIDVYPTAL